jgi:hypothetical protein
VVSFESQKRTSWVGARKQRQAYKNKGLLKSNLPGLSKKKSFIVVPKQVTNSAESQIHS